MPIFLYKAYGPAGDLAEGEVEAASPEAAAEALWTGSRLVPFALTPADGGAVPWWRRELGGSGALSALELAAFTREFATLVTAGIPLADALRILKDETAGRKAPALADSLLAHVLKGGALSEAVARRPADFPADYASVVRAGEAGGRLGAALDELASLLERRAELGARLRSALVYPAILLTLSVAALGMIVGVLVPGIAPMFGEGGRSPPAAMHVLMALHAHWLEIALTVAVVGGGAGLAILAALADPDRRLAFDRRLLGLWLIGPFLLRQDSARYARTLGTLLKAGVPLLAAAASARGAVANTALAAGLAAAIDAIREGAALHTALRRHTSLPPLALRMAAIGEETARLDAMLLRLAEMLEQKTRHDLDRFMTVFTPAVTVLVAAVIGALIVTVMTAILSLNDLAVS